MNSNIVITGLGAVTPLGVGVEEFWKNLTAGKCAISEIQSIDVSNLPVKNAGQVLNFNPKDYLPTKLTLDMEPYMQYAYIAAEEAIKQSGLETHSNRVGIVMGSALSGIGIIDKTGVDLAVKGRAASPKFLVKAMGNIAAAQLSINYGIQGPDMTVSTACSSGGDALTLATLMIRSGMADAMIVMAGEAATTATLVQSLTKTGALSKTGESLPFDKNRNGFVLGEGGGCIVIEKEECAKARGAKILAKLLGVANNTDAYNTVSPNPEGTGAAACMRLALDDAGISPAEVGYINAHGTATHAGDIAETKAIDEVFGKGNVFVSSTKGSTGHMMGAGGIVELISCIKALETGVLPVNVGLTEQDEECDLTIVTEENKQQTVQVAMSNAFGFGGQNSSIIVGKA
ncbi:MAG: beta-ketoacyl-[acyl-carrier-protein] synthase family protein [Lachnospiraceae bacterium]|nr:beta-ketoacyl-[acyl-carrier-protein] synthase family protein [Lachnospiraceae bacterium]